MAVAITKPEFTEPLRDECVHEGKAVHLECRFTGEPPPQIQWMCNDVQILPSAMFQVPCVVFMYLRWRRRVVISGVRRMNEVNARRARLIPGWVTVFGRVYHLGM